MGSENSKSAEQRTCEYTDKAIAAALERQRKMYEAKCEELRRTQRRPQVLVINHDNSNTNDVPRITPQLQTVNAAPNVLYPNLANVGNNNVQSTAAYPSHNINNPSTPSCSRTFQFSQPVPSAPTASTIALSPSTIPPMVNTKPSEPTSKPRGAETKNSMSIVNCVTCSKELGSKIYQCKNGHSSCTNCKFRLYRCGTCRFDITDMRNITLEITIEEMKAAQIQNTQSITCPNASDGCCLHFKENELEKHLKECPYNVMDCPWAQVFGGCLWKGKINHIVSHFNELHPDARKADVDKEMFFPNLQFDHKVLHFVNIGSYNFLIHIEINQTKKIIYMTAQLLGTKISAGKWTYELNVYNKMQPRRKYQFVDVCHSNITPVHEIFDSGNCVQLSLNYAKTFTDCNQVAYKFFLKKVYNPRIKRN